MKKSIVFFIIFVLIVSGAYAQNMLRDGIYMMEGSPDMAHIYNIPQYRGNFHITWFIGSTFDNPIYHHAGYTIQNTMYAVIFWFDNAYITSIFGANHGVVTGLQVAYIIRNNMTFVDGVGQTWTWRREMPR